MKKIFTIIFMIFIFGNITAKDTEFTKAPKNLSKELLERTWGLDIIGIKDVYISITFENENVYKLYSPFGGDLSNGTYFFNENTITLNPSKSSNYKYYDKLFEDGKPLVLIYDPNYNTMDFVGVLKNENVILTNGIERTPIDAQCWIDGKKAQKVEKWIEATDNIRLRLLPSLTGTISNYCYNHYFMTLHNELSKAGYKISLDNFIQCDKLNLLLKGMVCKSIAHTVEKETIDGISDYWYYIEMTDYTDPGWTEFYWVFGGYLKILTSPQKNLPVLFESAKEKGILKKL